MMLDEKGTVIAERFRLDVVVDEFPEAGSAVDVGAASSGLRASEQSEPHVRSFQIRTESGSRA